MPPDFGALAGTSDLSSSIELRLTGTDGPGPCRPLRALALALLALARADLTSKPDEPASSDDEKPDVKG